MNGVDMSAIGWTGFAWIVLSTLLSLNGFYANYKHEYKALILTKASAQRSLAIPVLDIVAIVVLALCSGVTGAAILAALAVAMTAPIIADIWQAYMHILIRSTTHTEVRVVLLILRLIPVAILAFV